MVFTDWQYKAELLVTFHNTAGGPSVAQLGQHQVGFFFSLMYCIPVPAPPWWDKLHFPEPRRKGKLRQARKWLVHDSDGSCAAGEGKEWGGTSAVGTEG